MVLRGRTEGVVEVKILDRVDECTMLADVAESETAPVMGRQQELVVGMAVVGWGKVVRNRGRGSGGSEVVMRKDLTVL